MHITVDFTVQTDFKQPRGMETPNFDPSWIHEPLRSIIHIIDQRTDPSYFDQMIHGGFGLIWDSATYPQVTGGLGQYRRMAMPHKLSLYASAGILSSVFSHSCVASLVTTRKIGWAIDALSQLDDLITSVSDDEYAERARNLDVFSHLIRSGYYTKRAIFQLIGALNGEPSTQPHSDYHMKVGYEA